MFISRLEEESAEMICGPQLTETNECVSQCFSRVTGAFLTIHDYISIICDGKKIDYCLHLGVQYHCI